jgi:hypothetical protein
MKNRRGMGYRRIQESKGFIVSCSFHGSALNGANRAVGGQALYVYIGF